MSNGTATPFRVDLQIRKDDIDELGHVNNIVYLRWVQEAAQKHWRRLSEGSPEADAAWVVLRHEIDYHRAVVAGDRVHALTWVGETGPVKSIRHVTIRDASERLVAESKTVWCLVDRRSGLPRRIPPGIRSMLDG